MLQHNHNSAPRMGNQVVQFLKQSTKGYIGLFLFISAATLHMLSIIKKKSTLSL